MDERDARIEYFDMYAFFYISCRVVKKFRYFQNNDRPISFSNFAPNFELRRVCHDHPGPPSLS